MYAPLVATALSGIAPAKTGVAIGFYNLTINIAVPVGIAATAKLVDVRPTFLAALSTATSEAEAVAATILWLLVALAAVGLVIYLISEKVLGGSETAAQR